MYDELIKRLRSVEEMLKVAQFKEAEILIEQAADAIEDMGKCLDNVADAHNEGYDVGYWAGRRDYERKWIPVTERLPEDDALMLVNYIDNRPDAVDIWIGWHEMENVWYIDGEEHSKERGNEVIAWMPLPEPYKGGDAE